jgi:hypothetical protein
MSGGEGDSGDFPRARHHSERHDRLERCPAGPVGNSQPASAYVDESTFIDMSNSCSGGRIEVRRESVGVYFVRFVGNSASLAVGIPNQDGASTEFSGDADNTITISGNDAGAFRVDVVRDLPDASPGGRQDGKFTMMLL